MQIFKLGCYADQFGCCLRRFGTTKTLSTPEISLLCSTVFSFYARFGAALNATHFARICSGCFAATVERRLKVFENGVLRPSEGGSDRRLEKIT